MQVVDVPIAGVKLIKPHIFLDKRGFFLETFQQQRYQELLNISYDFVQDNYSRSVQGVLRGLHFQRKYPQGKLVQTIRGEIFDVIVDLREDSRTYGQWYGTVLSEKTMTQLWIPPGMAHGFLVLSDTADIIYKCTDYYHPEVEECLIWNDPTIGIAWPLMGEPLLSEKDMHGKRLLDI